MATRPDRRGARKSRFLSWILRHAAGKVGLVLDDEGWAEVDGVLRCAEKQGIALTATSLQEIVSADEKGRYEISSDGKRIRAVYGHSVPVQPAWSPEVPPRRLYHGTAIHLLESILNGGLRPGRRRFVHLSTTPEAAAQVGRRHGRPVVLEVDTAGMHEDGVRFYRAGKEIWLVEEVPFQFLRTLDDEPGEE
jgi:putative RNA 2'-phosphotransferase